MRISSRSGFDRQSKFYRDIVQTQVSWMKGGARDMNMSLTLDMANVFKNSCQSAVVLQCMAQDNSTPWCLRRGTFRLYLGAPSSTVGRQDQFRLGPAGTTRFSYTVRPGFHHHVLIESRCHGW